MSKIRVQKVPNSKKKDPTMKKVLKELCFLSKTSFDHIGAFYVPDSSFAKLIVSEWVQKLAQFVRSPQYIEGLP